MISQKEKLKAKETAKCMLIKQNNVNRWPLKQHFDFIIVALAVGKSYHGQKN